MRRQIQGLIQELLEEEVTELLGPDFDSRRGRPALGTAPLSFEAGESVV